MSASHPHERRSAYNLANDFGEEDVHRQWDPIINDNIVEVAILRPGNCSSRIQLLNDLRIRQLEIMDVIL